MSHENSKAGRYFPDLQRELAHLTFSRQANLSQLISDWSQLKEIIFVNNKPLQDIFIEQGIDTQELPDAKDPNIQKKFNEILSQLLPSNPNWDESSLVSQLPEILHQGGLLSNLETQMVIKLTDQGLRLDNIGKEMERRIYLNNNEEGFSVKEIFAYHGNISKQDPDDPQFEQKNYKKPLLTGACQYDIIVSKNTLQPKLTDFDLTSPEETLEALSGKKITIETTKQFKKNYEQILIDNTLDLSNSNSEPFFDN